MLKVIMVSGYKRAGKDFVSGSLHNLVEGSKLVALAEPLKDIVATTMGIEKWELDNYKNDMSDLHILNDDKNYEHLLITNFRSMLQRFGTEAMKKWFGDDVWVDLLISKLPSSGVLIISDWRFKTEYEALSKVAEVITVRVKDDNLKGDGHISEHDLDDFNFDVVMDNTAKDDSIMYPVRSLAQLL